MENDNCQRNKLVIVGTIAFGSFSAAVVVRLFVGLFYLRRPEAFLQNLPAFIAACLALAVAAGVATWLIIRPFSPSAVQLTAAKRWTWTAASAPAAPCAGWRRC